MDAFFQQTAQAVAQVFFHDGHQACIHEIKLPCRRINPTPSFCPVNRVGFEAIGTFAEETTQAGNITMPEVMQTITPDTASLPSITRYSDGKRGPSRHDRGKRALGAEFAVIDHERSGAQILRQAGMSNQCRLP